MVEFTCVKCCWLWSNLVLLWATLPKIESLALPAELGVARDGLFQPFIFELCWIILVSYLNIKIHNMRIHIHIDVHLHIHTHTHIHVHLHIKLVFLPGAGFFSKNSTRDPLCRNPEFSREISEKRISVEQWKKGPWECWGYFWVMTSYPVIWRLFHKPWNKDPY